MKTSITSILTDVVNIRQLLAVAAFGLLATGPAAHADMVLEMDQADSSATRIGPAGNYTIPGTCFDSTFRLLYQGDNYAACQGSGGAETAGYWFDTKLAPRVTGGNFVYDNSGLYCVYAKWADGVERGTNVRFQIDWNSPGIAGFFPDTTLSVNQTINGGQWVKLACSTFPAAGQAPVVKCSNFGLPAGKYAICDGIKITRENVDGGDIINSSITGSDIASNSVSSTDLSNEAGADFAGGGQNTALTATPVTVRSVVVTAPSSGKVIVNASGYFDFNEGLTTDRDGARCSITTGTIIDFTALIIAGESGNDDEVDYMPFAATRGYNVSAGSTTYRLVCDEYDGNVLIGDSHLTAIFVPSTY